jgi:hypothetical protein
MPAALTVESSPENRSSWRCRTPNAASAAWGGSIGSIRPERKAELEKFAVEHGQTPADALDDAIASYLQWQTQTFEEDVAAAQEALDDLQAGRSVSLEEFDQQMRLKYGIPRQAPCFSASRRGTAFRTDYGSGSP